MFKKHLYNIFVFAGELSAKLEKGIASSSNDSRTAKLQI